MLSSSPPRYQTLRSSLNRSPADRETKRFTVWTLYAAERIIRGASRRLDTPAAPERWDAQVAFTHGWNRMIDSSSVPRRSERVLSQHVGDTSVLLDPRSGEYYSLDEVGARIWDLCDGNRSAEAIALTLSEEYDADLATIQADVVRLLRELQDAKLVDIR